MTTPTSIKGHALQGNGAAFTQEGERLFPGKTGGWGHGRCECGIICADTGTAKARKDWHKKHLAKVAREASAPAKAAPAKAAPDKAPAPAPAPQAEATAQFKGVAKKFWKVLGRDGAVVLLSEFKDVTIKAFHGADQTVELEGDPEAVTAAVAFLQEAWVLAGQEFSRWKRDTPAYQALGPMGKDDAANRRARVAMEREFFTQFTLDHEALRETLAEQR